MDSVSPFLHLPFICIFDLLFPAVPHQPQGELAASGDTEHYNQWRNILLCEACLGPPLKETRQVMSEETQEEWSMCWQRASMEVLRNVEASRVLAVGQ